MTYVVNNVIIECPECKQKIRAPLFRSRKLSIKCPTCSNRFTFDCKRYGIKQAVVTWSFGLASAIFLAASITLPFIALPKLNIAIAEVKGTHEKIINEMERDFSKELIFLKNEYSEEIAKVDKDKLREQATVHYAKIWQERENYNSRYAITPREKAQLEMLALSKDRTKTIGQIIRNIAIKAAPANSSVNVNQMTSGIRLDIDFDMSELTSGEEGSRTKHNTIPSLKKEVVKLVSRVTNDVYQFCRDLDLKTIAIGCRHYVNEYYRDYYSTKSSYSSKSNTVLYKVRLDKKDIKELRTNPFLDVYSTTQYLKVEHDEFSNLTISYEK